MFISFHNKSNLASRTKSNEQLFVDFLIIKQNIVQPFYEFRTIYHSFILIYIHIQYIYLSVVQTSTYNILFCNIIPVPDPSKQFVFVLFGIFSVRLNISSFLSPIYIFSAFYLPCPTRLKIIGESCLPNICIFMTPISILLITLPLHFNMKRAYLRPYFMTHHKSANNNVINLAWSCDRTIGVFQEKQRNNLQTKTKPLQWGGLH